MFVRNEQFQISVRKIDLSVLCYHIAHAVSMRIPLVFLDSVFEVSLVNDWTR